MPSNPRRRFLKQTVAAASGLALTSSCQTQPSDDEPASPEFLKLGVERLEALARIVLPSSEMNEMELAEQAQSFQNWLDGFNPVAEQNLPYLVTDEIPYGPPHPGPQWMAQLDALDLEAKHRFEKMFVELSPQEQLGILERQLPRELPESLPRTQYASHVAVALMAHYFHSTEANDQCYQRAIGRQTCRGLDSASKLPDLVASDSNGDRS